MTFTSTDWIREDLGFPECCLVKNYDKIKDGILDIYVYIYIIFVIDMNVNAHRNCKNMVVSSLFNRSVTWRFTAKGCGTY